MKLRSTWVFAACVCVMAAGFGCLAQSKNKQQIFEIPFDFYRNEIIVQVKINGQGPFNMMLDTGTNPSGIDLATARNLGLKLDPVGSRASGGGTAVNLAYETRLPLVELGGITVKNLEAVALDLTKFSTRLGKQLHGVIGHSFLNGRIVQIDYPKQVLRFHSQPLFSKPVGQSNSAKRTTLPFRYDDDVLLDDVFVNGKKVVADLDTGSDGTFKLTPAAVSSLGLEEDVRRAQVSESAGFNGSAENRQGSVSNVTVGAISVDAPQVIFFGKGTGRDDKRWGLNIGNAFLKDFVVTIDYRSKLLTLERP
jgi:predicted aspartyl protease